jgi:uncharacterized phage protein gp47/JayE
MADFTIPEFLLHKSAKEIYERIKEILPADIDTSQGSHVFNLTMPTALVLAELYESILPQVVQVIFPQWSYGEYLDAHAADRGMARRSATPATGRVTITGIPGTVVPEGSIFSTVSLNSEDPSISYSTDETVTIPQGGTVVVGITCEQAGTVGNAAANTVVLVSSTITGISSVTNTAAITGGTDEEDDASLIERIVEFDTSQGDSFTGNIADYHRWATSVDGVGNAAIIPANDDTGLVTIVITDANGDPATETLCNTVYNYIMQPQNPQARLAPINAYIQVTAPTMVVIAIKSNVETKDNYDIQMIGTEFLTRLENYLDQAVSDGEIKITSIMTALLACAGVYDISDLQIGIVEEGAEVEYDTQNIPISGTQLPSFSASYITLTPVI